MAGSVVKRNKVWHIRYELPPGPNSRRRQKMQACPGLTKREAEMRLHDVIRSLHAGDYAEPSKQTVAEYLAYWMSSIAPQHLGPGTVGTAVEFIKAYILPWIGGMPLAKLRPIDIQELQVALLHHGSRSRGALNPSTVRKAQNILRLALEHATRLRMIPNNPAKMVDSPRESHREICSLDQQEISRLMAMLSGSAFRVPVLIALCTGMRRGEVCGLRWEDIDTDRQTLMVRHSVALVGSQPLIKEPKAGKTRAVQIGEFLLTVLQEQREACSASTSDLRSGFCEQGWVCPSPDGSVLKPNALTHAFRRIADRLGIAASLHGLRHTQVNLLLQAGVPAKEVAARLGHASVTTTLDIYAHSNPAMQAEAARVIEGVIGAASGNEKSQCVQDVCTRSTNA